MKSWISVLLATFLALQGLSQTRISGTVLDVRRQPLPGASVQLKDSYDGATADSLGRFAFVTTDTGRQVLQVSAIGYRLIELEIFVTGTEINQQLVLKQEVTEMNAVVITAGAFEASDRKRAAAVLSSIDIVTTASANADVTGALKTLPGAQQVGESEGLFVRGGTAGETRTFIDGTLVNNFFFSSVPGIAQRGRFSPFLFKGTVFSTGGYSALYGQALSAALILETIDLPEQSSASLNASVIGIGGGFQQLSRNKKASWGIDANYTNLDLAFALIPQQQQFSRSPQANSIDANFRIKTSAQGMLKYYGTFNNNRIAFMQPSLDSLGYFDRFSLRTNNMYHNLSWKESLGRRWKLQAGVSYTYNADTINFGMQDAAKQDVLLQGLEFKEAALQASGNYLNGKLVFEKRFRGLNILRFGSEVNRSDDRSGFTIYNGTRFMTRIPETITAVFAEQDLYLTNHLAAKLGVRGEYSQLLARTNVAPRISLAYKLGSQSQASLAYGEFYQNPELRQLPMLAPLQFQRATHYIAQYQKTTRLTTLRIEAFHKQYHNLIKTGDVNGRQLAANNDGFGEASGIELFWRDKQHIKNLDYWISYSFLDTRRDFLNFPGLMTPNFAARHTASVVAKKFVTDWKMNLNFSYNYASGRPYYNILIDGANNKPFLNDAGRTPDFHNASFAINYLPHIGKKDARMFAVYVLSVSNVMNFRQVFGYTYSANGQRRQALEPPARMFVFIGAFISFGVDRTEDAINNNL